MEFSVRVIWRFNSIKYAVDITEVVLNQRSINARG